MSAKLIRVLAQVAEQAPTLALALAVVMATVALAGCAAVGPDYQRPALAMDPAFIGAPNAQPTAADIATFWRGFGDERLNALIERGLAVNGDVKLAMARLQEARASQDEADAAQRPSLGIDTSATRSIAPITQQPGLSRSARTGNVFDSSFLANWELDLFGRLRRGSEAAAAQTAADVAHVAAAQTSVAAEVARNYLELRGLQQRLAYTEASLKNQRDTLKLTQARLDNGRGTRLDLARSQGLVAATEAALPTLQSAIERAVFRLATLTAQPPRALLVELGTPAPLPGLPFTDLAALPAGTTEQWLQRRPDLIAAERQLAAATAGIGIAKSALYPRLSLSGLLGLNAASTGNLGRGASGRYSLGADLAWTPFDLGGIRARIRASEARAQQSLASFETAVAAALEETEGAFSSYTRSAQRAEKLDLAARSAEEAARLSRVRYEAGVTDFLAVLDAERELLAQRDQLVQAQVGTATALVAVYRSLGGGWGKPS
jgi:multidrug efflux system outer membrane protein